MKQSRTLHQVLRRNLLSFLGISMLLLALAAFLGIERLTRLHVETSAAHSLDQVHRHLTQRFGRYEGVADALTESWRLGVLDPRDGVDSPLRMLGMLPRERELRGVGILSDEGHSISMMSVPGGWRVSQPIETKNGRMKWRDQVWTFAGSKLGEAQFSEGQDARLRPWYLAVPSNAPGRWTAPYQTQDDLNFGRWMVAYVRPVLDLKGKRLGVSIVVTLLEDLESMWREAQPFPGCWMLLMDGEGHAIFASSGLSGPELSLRVSRMHSGDKLDVNGSRFILSRRSLELSGGNT